MVFCSSGGHAFIQWLPTAPKPSQPLDDSEKQAVIHSTYNYYL